MYNINVYDKSKYNSYNYFIYYKYSIIFIKYKSPIFYSIINYITLNQLLIFQHHLNHLLILIIHNHLFIFHIFLLITFFIFIKY